MQLVSSFSQWCPPVKAESARWNHLPNWRIAGTQRNWISTFYPEVNGLDDGIEIFLSTELSSARQCDIRGPGTSTSILLAIGEILDSRRSKAPKTHPVVAMASGEARNVLRLIGLSQEEWAWNRKGMRVNLHKPNTGLSGEWSRDNLPISMIKFATHRPRKDPIHWVLVQKATLTVICQPELNLIPAQDYSWSGESLGSARLSVNPVCEIRSEQTGGGRQTNLSSRHHGGVPPQIAIINDLGHWSIWDIIGPRRMRHRPLKPVMKMCGSILSGPAPSLPIKPSGTPEQHNVLWLSLEPSATDRDESNMLPLEHDGSATLPSRALLMCRSTIVRLFDVDTERFFDATQLLLTSRTQRVLDVKLSPLQTSQALILTSTVLFLVAAKERSTGQIFLEIVASCPHRQDSANQALKMDVSLPATLHGRPACFACVRSAKESQMNIIWFTTPPAGLPVQCHSEHVFFPKSAPLSNLGMLPVAKREGVTGTEADKAQAVAGFFQLLSLGEDLSLNNALCAWFDEPGLTVGPPDRFMGRRARHLAKRERKRFLRIMEDAFVVPDGYDDRLGTAGIEQTKVFAEGERESHPPQDINMTPKTKRVANFQILGRGIPVEPEDSDQDMIEDITDVIRQAVRKRMRDGIMPRCSL